MKITSFRRGYLLILCSYFNASLDYLFSFKEQIYPNIRKEANYEQIGKRIRELRENLNINQELLARRTNSKRSNISGYENNKHLISTKNLYTICKKYKISVDYLLGKIESPKYLK